LICIAALSSSWLFPGALAQPTDFVLQFASTSSSSSNNDGDIVGTPEQQCRRFFAIDANNNIVDQAGEVCLLLDNVSFPNQLTVDYSTTAATAPGNNNNKWIMTRTATWFGTDINDLPVNAEGEPTVQSFPYVTNFGTTMTTAVSTSTFTVPLATIPGINDDGTIDFSSSGCTQEGQFVQLLGVSQADLIRLDPNDASQQQQLQNANGWADGLVPADPADDLWALYNFTLECVATTVQTTPIPAPPPFNTVAPIPAPVPVPVPTPVPAVPTPPPTLPPIDSNLLPDGSACTFDPECQSGRCSSAGGFCLNNLGTTCTSNTDCASNACLDGLCGTCSTTTTDSSILTQSVVERSRVAGLLTEQLQKGFNSTPVPLEFGTIYNRGTPNLSMVAKVEGVCYGIFAPNEPTPLDAFGSRSVTAFQQSCLVHERAFRAYFAQERQLFELRLAQCASTCITIENEELLGFTDTPILSVALDVDACPIVLAGHGLGGATAVVASMMLSDLEPQVMTFGAPRTVQAQCPLLRRSSTAEHYRMVNLAFVNSFNTFLFDYVPQLSMDGGGGSGDASTSLVHYGNPVLLDVLDTIVLEVDDDSTRASVVPASNSADDVDNPSQLSLYNARLKALLEEESCFPVPATDAWENGHWCDKSDICLSDRCRSFLTPSPDSTVGVCAEKQAAGALCEMGNDCLSGTCNAGLCTAGANTPAPTSTATPPPPSGGGGGGSGTLGPCDLCSIGTECQSGVCVTFEIPGGSTSVCSETPAGTMSTGCFCFPEANEQCTEGRCESDVSGALSLCVSPLAPCQACDENSDCISNNCLDGVCGLQSGGPADCDNGGGGGVPPPVIPTIPPNPTDAPEPQPVCTTLECVEDNDCPDSDFCRTVGLVRPYLVFCMFLCYVFVVVAAAAVLFLLYRSNLDCLSFHPNFRYRSVPLTKMESWLRVVLVIQPILLVHAKQEIVSAMILCYWTWERVCRTMATAIITILLRPWRCPFPILGFACLTNNVLPAVVPKNVTQSNHVVVIVQPGVAIIKRKRWLRLCVGVSFVECGL